MSAFFLLQCLLFWVKKVSGTRSETLWEFNFKFLKQVTSFAIILFGVGISNTIMYSLGTIRLIFKKSPTHLYSQMTRRTCGAPVSWQSLHWSSFWFSFPNLFSAVVVISFTSFSCLCIAPHNFLLQAGNP